MDVSNEGLATEATAQAIQTGTDYIDDCAVYLGLINTSNSAIYSIISNYSSYITGITSESNASGITATGAGTTLQAKYHTGRVASLMVVNNGATSWTVGIEVSPDGTNWETESTHTNVTPGTGKFAYSKNDRPRQYWRYNVTAIVPGIGSISVFLRVSG